MDSDEMFVEVTNALEVVGFSTQEVDMVFSILASVMHIGHIKFESSSELAPASISADSMHAITTVAKLLQFDVKQFQKALTLAITFTRGETIRRQYTVAQALGELAAVAGSPGFDREKTSTCLHTLTPLLLFLSSSFFVFFLLFFPLSSSYAPFFCFPVCISPCSPHPAFLWFLLLYW